MLGLQRSASLAERSSPESAQPPFTRLAPAMLTRLADTPFLSARAAFEGPWPNVPRAGASPLAGRVPGLSTGLPLVPPADGTEDTARRAGGRSVAPSLGRLRRARVGCRLRVWSPPAGDRGGELFAHGSARGVLPTESESGRKGWRVWPTLPRLLRVAGSDAARSMGECWLVMDRRARSVPGAWPELGVPPDAVERKLLTRAAGAAALVCTGGSSK